MVVDQLRDYLEHGNVGQRGQFPACDAWRASRPTGVAIANANVPNMLGQISTAMAHAGLNIHNMVNKSRGDMAYTLVDVDSAVGDGGADRHRAHPRRAGGALPAGGLSALASRPASRRRRRQAPIRIAHLDLRAERAQRVAP